MTTALILPGGIQLALHPDEWKEEDPRIKEIGSGGTDPGPRLGAPSIRHRDTSTQGIIAESPPKGLVRSIENARLGAELNIPSPLSGLDPQEGAKDVGLQGIPLEHHLMSDKALGDLQRRRLRMLIMSSLLGLSRLMVSRSLTVFASTLT